MSGQLRTHEIPATVCPACSHELVAATGVEPGVPRPTVGDLSVCGHCAAALEFTDTLGVQILTSERFAALRPSVREGLKFAQLAVMKAIGLRTLREARGQ